MHKKHPKPILNRVQNSTFRALITQPPQSIPPFEQAILDFTQIVDDFMAEQKGINAHSNLIIVTLEDNLNKKLDGL